MTVSHSVHSVFSILIPSGFGARRYLNHYTKKNENAKSLNYFLFMFPLLTQTGHLTPMQVFGVKFAIDAVIVHYLEDIILRFGKADLGDEDARFLRL